LLHLPWLAGGLAIYLGARLLGRRRRSLVRLRNGRRVRLVSAVALLDGSPDELLALEYLSPLPAERPEELRLEARGLVQAVGARLQYAGCRRAVVTTWPRAPGGSTDGLEELVFTFRRHDGGSDWYPTDALD